MLILLAAAAGCIDAVSYLAMGEVFTAAMTGNTVLLGIAFGQGEGLAALRSLMALGGFMAGGVLGALIVDRGPRADWPRAVTAAFALEAVILAAIAVGWHLAGDGLGPSSLDLLVAVTGLAMGLQSVAVNRLGVAGIATTYVTGTLTHLSVRFVRWARHRAEQDVGGPQPPRDPWLPAGVWLAYGVGAVTAGGLKLLWPSAGLVMVAGAPVQWQIVALALSILPVVIVVVAAMIRAGK